MQHPKIISLFVMMVMGHAHSGYSQLLTGTVYQGKKNAPRPAINILSQVCKNKIFLFTDSTETPIEEVTLAAVAKKTGPAIRVNGNILYSFNYRSYIDTPFAQNDLQQHMLQTNLFFTVHQKYPVKMSIASRSSNSPYFKNVFDINVEFNRRSLIENIKEQLRKRLQSVTGNAGLLAAQQQYNEYKQKAADLEQWVNHPERVKELMLAKERELENKARSAKNIFQVNETGDFKYIHELKNAVTPAAATQWAGKVGDSASSKAQRETSTFQAHAENLEAKKKELAQLQMQAKNAGEQLSQTRKKFQDSVARLKQQVNKISSPDEVRQYMEENKLPKDSLTKFQRLLLSVNRVGLGRSMVDYSELTVKNISLTGGHLEMNPGKFYFAAAAGKVNYRFRDFVFKNEARNNKQALYLVRAGYGKKEGNNMIFTVYTGKKALLNYITPNNTETAHRVFGFSVETKLAVNADNYIIAEFAKSSYYNPPGAPGFDIRKAFNLKERANEAYSIKLFSHNRQTNTRLTAYYRKMGEYFQSYNLYPINVNMDAWMVKADQHFWKKRLQVNLAIRKNDFNSPVALPSSLNTKTVFKSAQASLRVPRYPYISAGYYPSSQLSVMNDNVLVESQYNTLNATIGHNYNLAGISMNTHVIYTRLYNTGTDTGFLYFNAKNYSVNHSVFLDAFTLQSSYTFTQQKLLEIGTLENTLSYRFKDRISVTGGFKWNRLNNTKDLYGGLASVNIYLRRIGMLQLQYDKTYLPSHENSLRAVDMGKLSFYKEF